MLKNFCFIFKLEFYDSAIRQRTSASLMNNFFDSQLLGQRETWSSKGINGLYHEGNSKDLGNMLLAESERVVHSEVMDWGDR